MKADIPDKILINRGEDGKLHHSYWTTDQQLVPFEDTIYIRKDALLDWLENKIKTIKMPDSGFVSRLTYLVYQDVIEHLNEM